MNLNILGWNEAYENAFQEYK
ncbi:MAG: hypothetical protein K0R80_2423, partial [Clostridia bacterium]|nr:hypothetical protein [Clostridia bacterium]